MIICRASAAVDHLESKKPEFPSEKDVKALNLIERAKEEIESLMHKGKSPHHHHKETHGRSDDIDESTPISEVKGPNVFERAKEEIEALIETIRPKKDSNKAASSPKKEGGLPVSIGRGMEKSCSPHSHNGD
ncbi:hypothetical protein Fot_35080 [Forsythia ovata]|uniref:Uncharacterized protein n=1 Tax=Forsythia ovata TaxID=205694 RepID=A0ABD1SNI5_9LAMI